MSLIGMILAGLLAVGLYELGQRVRLGSRTTTEAVVVAVFVASFLLGAAMFATLADGLRFVVTVAVLVGVGGAVGSYRRTRLAWEEEERTRLEAEVQRLRAAAATPDAELDG